jgi:hypothetical protein
MGFIMFVMSVFWTRRGVEIMLNDSFGLGDTLSGYASAAIGLSTLEQYYRGKMNQYQNGGSYAAQMRDLPINNEKKYEKDVFNEKLLLLDNE